MRATCEYFEYSYEYLPEPEYISPYHICYHGLRCRIANCSRKRYHPLWVVELFICVFHLHGWCDKGSECTFNHISWDNMVVLLF